MPGLVGPLIAGSLAENVSWRAVFWLVPVFVVPPAIQLIPRMAKFQGGVMHASARQRLVAGVLATVGLLAIQDGVLRLSVVGAIRRLLPVGALTFRRGLPTGVMMRGMLAAAYFGAEVFIPLALVETRGITVTHAGLILATAAVFWSVGSWAQGRLPGERDRSNAVRIGAAIVALSILSLPFSLLGVVPVWTAGLSWAGGAFGMGLSIPSVSMQVMRLSPPADQGVNSASTQIVDSVLSVVAVALLGVWHAAAVAGGGATASMYTILWLGAAGFAVAALAVARRMRPSLSV